MNSKANTDSVYLEVALPIPPLRNFTYRAPVETIEAGLIGKRVVVPFGNRRLTGFVVEVNTSLDDKQSIDDSKIKGIVEIVDEEPLIIDPVMELARWASRYYAASLGELLKGSLPAGLTARFREIFEITDQGRMRLSQFSGRLGKNEELLLWLGENGPTGIDDLVEMFGRNSGSAARLLVERGDAVSRFEERKGGARPMFRKAVRLLAFPPETKLTEQQGTIILCGRTARTRRSTAECGDGYRRGSGRCEIRNLSPPRGNGQWKDRGLLPSS